MVFVSLDFDCRAFESWSQSPFLSLLIVRAMMWLANSSGSMLCGLVLIASDSGTLVVASIWTRFVKVRS